MMLQKLSLPSNLLYFIHYITNITVFQVPQPRKITFFIKNITKKDRPLQLCKRRSVLGTVYNGDEENRTPVRKPIPANFYEFSLLLRASPFPLLKASRHAFLLGRLWYTARLQPLPHGVHH